MATRVHLPQDTQRVLANWYSRDLLESGTFVQGSLLGRLFGWTGQAAVTIDGTVHLTPRAGDLESRNGIVLVAHELFHVGQQRDMGWWRFLLRYLLGWRPAHVRNGRSHPLEAPAYARGDEVRGALEREGRS